MVGEAQKVSSVTVTWKGGKDRAKTSVITFNPPTDDWEVIMDKVQEIGGDKVANIDVN